MVLSIKRRSSFITTSYSQKDHVSLRLFEPTIWIFVHNVTPRTLRFTPNNNMPLLITNTRMPYWGISVLFHNLMAKSVCNLQTIIFLRKRKSEGSTAPTLRFIIHDCMILINNLLQLRILGSLKGTDGYTSHFKIRKISYIKISDLR